MPLYEYQCTACAHRFEVIRKFSDVPLTECPLCQGKVEKLISSPAFHLKGSGWYATDYAKKPEGSKTDAKGEGTSDSKAESGSTESKSSESKSSESKSSDGKSSDSKSKESSSSDSGAKESSTSTSKSSS